MNREAALVVFSGGQDSTTCLFWAKRNFKKVYALSFLYGQKHQKEVELAREIARKAEVEFEVMDVSFISQTLILPALYSVLAERALLVSLVKPQFEAGREAIGKGGIVKNKADRAAAIRRVADSAALCGFTFCEITPSPITGGDGNEEFLCCFAKGGARPAYAGDVQRRIGQAVGLK